MLDASASMGCVLCVDCVLVVWPDAAPSGAFQAVNQLIQDYRMYSPSVSTSWSVELPSAKVLQRRWAACVARPDFCTFAPLIMVMESDRNKPCFVDTPKIDETKHAVAFFVRFPIESLGMPPRF